MEVQVAIIGGGASAVSILYSLNKVLDKALDYRINIDIYEPNKEVGRGLAYIEDSEIIKLNRPPIDMSIDIQNKNHFLDWVSKNAKDLYDFSEYLPRSLYGKYLNVNYLETSTSLLKKNIKVNHIREKVRGIKKVTSELYKVLSSGNKESYYNFVILAIGGKNNDDPYDLMEDPNFINEPYPLEEKLYHLKPDDKVGVIGSSLTAIDVFLYLKQKNVKKCTMLSRSGQLPSVRGLDSDINLHYLKEKILRCKNVNLECLLTLFLKEFEEKSISWKEVFLEKNEEENYTTFSKKIRLAKENNTWFDVLRETHPILDEIWVCLNDEERKYFVKRLLPLYIPRRAAIPLINAREILDSLETKDLQIIGGLQRIEQYKNRFRTCFSNNQDNQSFDIIINATGLSGENTNNELIETMLEDNLISTHIAGGIRVDFNTGSVISNENKTNPNIKAIGHITSGNFFVVNNLEFIAKKSFEISCDLANHIKNNIMSKEFA
ncbi:FAD/NAD(P)-binding protein [Lysinibacillus sp. NPDC097214]|uniref:FAD/NAD(P)-binding protein n=1 Tax=Lysinibacillus sp. NPDC097214 TaxID=3390584 RepID=UPI003D056C06